jgi:cyclopropane fatty-acyl-phospholipid synthase-like methyltransferase
MVWDKAYTQGKKLWGEGPSELALFVGAYLKNSSHNQRELHVLDIGCGYGRDAFYLAQNANAYVIAVDNSSVAIDMAKELCPKELDKKIELLCYNFNELVDKYDVIFAANLYPILNREERAQFRETIRRCLKIGGLFFLSTLSVKDKHYTGKGPSVADEENSYRLEGGFLHLSTREELESDFNFLNISALFEREHDESHAEGETHHHISWILMGQMK